MDQNRLINKLIFKAVIETLTGLHIGGNNESFEIGGMNNPIIRDPLTNLPYIPGSSIKGKMRSELEWGLGVAGVNTDDSKADVSNDYRIVDLFGLGANKALSKKGVKFEGKKMPSRLIVRDAFPDGYETLRFEKRILPQIEDPKRKDTIGLWSRLDMGLPFTEWKKENSIKRTNSEANPRDMERIPAGSKFNAEFVFSHFKGDDIEVILKNLITAIGLLEDSYLGGSGSRGCGKIKMRLKSIECHDLKYYQNGNHDKTDAIAPLIGDGDFGKIDIQKLSEKCNE